MSGKQEKKAAAPKAAAADGKKADAKKADAKAAAPKADAKKGDAKAAPKADGKKGDAKGAAAAPKAAAAAPKAAAAPAPKKAAAPKAAPKAAAALGAYPVIKAALKRVPETLLKNRRRAAKLAEDRAAEATAAKRKAVASKRDYFKRAEKYVAEYRSAERSQIRLRRMAKASGNFYAEPEAKVAVVVRIRGTQAIDPRSRKILQLLRLRQVHNATFVKLNSASLNMLRLVMPYIAWGYPSKRLVKELIYKRGYGKINRQRIPLTDNTIIEGALGKRNIICMEDLVHEIFTCGPAFKEVNNFLWPFKLSSPNGGFDYIKKGFLEGGDAGRRDSLIADLITRMN
eukprot:c39472_g1_i1.p1 GENE.c39472_g1_i1~~c39472_g1_i1.p1  ORF type:complete len:342 (+),score=95.60 c39472_g1_i1:41-1066(+)